MGFFYSRIILYCKPLTPQPPLVFFMLFDWGASPGSAPLGKKPRLNLREYITMYESSTPERRLKRPWSKGGARETVLSSNRTPISLEMARPPCLQSARNLLLLFAGSLAEYWRPFISGPRHPNWIRRIRDKLWLDPPTPHRFLIYHPNYQTVFLNRFVRPVTLENSMRSSLENPLLPTPGTTHL